MFKAGRCALILIACVGATACGTLVSPYDATFDQSLNRYSEDTAKFLAAASVGGPERRANSKETAAYYAAAYNLLDRLSQRASLTRGLVPCPTNESLKSFAALATSNRTLPEDYQKFDCREFQLYAVRLYVDQLQYSHNNDGVLNNYEIKANGGALQTSIMGAIQTFLANKPSK